MTKVQVTFHTKYEEAAPETEGPFKGLPRTQCLQYIRVFELDYATLFIGHSVDFYGKSYRITSYTLNKPQIGIQVTEPVLTQLLADAKQHKQRLKKRVGGSIDARGLVQRAMYNTPLH